MSPDLQDGRVVGYIRVSTEDQADSGAGLEAQRTAIARECERHGWQLVGIYEDAGVSGGVPFADRPRGAEILETLRARQAGGLVVAKLDRLTRSTGDAERIFELFARRRWTLTVLDLGVDTSTPMGEAMAGVVAVFAKLERRLIGQRTREALAQKRAQGVRLGRAPAIDPATEELIVSRRRAGLPLRTIAAELNAAGVSTAAGGAAWYVSTIRRVLGRHDVPTFRPGRRLQMQHRQSGTPE